MTTFFTSDLHLGHARISELAGRPFTSVDEMNGTLIDNWNRVVGDNDRVIVLGDFAMGSIAESLPLAKQLRGHKVLIPGNHDRCWPGYLPSKRLPEWIAKYKAVGFAIWGTTVKFQISDGPRFRMCHFPYTGDSTDEDRYTMWRPINDGMWLLHGHVHEAWQVRDRMINVGVDVWSYTPVAAETLRGIIANAT